MITKAIVEEVINPYQVKVRIPLLNRGTDSAMSTKSADLNTATICSLPNCYVNIHVGDVVFVGFEDNTTYKAVILGHLCKESQLPSYSTLTLNDVYVNGECVLTDKTTIGNVSSSELSCLQGTRDNLQKQLDFLYEQLNILKEDRDALVQLVNEHIGG